MRSREQVDHEIEAAVQHLAALMQEHVALFSTNQFVKVEAERARALGNGVVVTGVLSISRSSA